jgi:putative GTP pyrophosphokinase
MLAHSIIRSYIKLECSVVKISKTQIDRLGERLRKGNISDDDLRLLDEYRRSFTEAYDSVVGRIRDELALEPTGRPAKSTTAISEKLRRESIRLTQIQDIAGCRLVVSDIADQEGVTASLTALFPDCVLVDRRGKPSHGYRAVHVIVTSTNKAVEIQVRTALQQAWAELSEKLADVIDPSIKYGGGEEDIKRLLSKASRTVARTEANESTVLELQQETSTMLLDVDLTEEQRAVITERQARIAFVSTRIEAVRKDTLDALRFAIEQFTNPAEQE